MSGRVILGGFPIYNIQTFGTYEQAKKRIELSIKILQAINRGKKRVAKHKIVEGPLMLIEGKVEDEEEESNDEDESKKEVDPPKKKGKMIITKP